MSFIVKLPIHCECCISFQSWPWLFQLVISLYICKLFSGLSHVFVAKLQCHFSTSSSFCLTFINKVIVVNKDHYSNSSLILAKMSKWRNASRRVGDHWIKFLTLG